MDKIFGYLNLNYNEKLNENIVYSCEKCNFLPILLDINLIIHMIILLNINAKIMELLK